METITFDRDITLMYVPATHFPEGIREAHEKLHATVPYSPARRYFGLSRPQNGVIRYWAAAEELQEGEAGKLKCDTMLLPSGTYASVTLPDYMKDLSAIERTFQSLLKHPDLAPDSYCVEWYISNKDMKCLVRLSR